MEGDVVAEELTIGGYVKGTIHANRVKLNSTAVVEGDIERWRLRRMLDSREHRRRASKRTAPKPKLVIATRRATARPRTLANFSAWPRNGSDWQITRRDWNPSRRHNQTNTTETGPGDKFKRDQRRWKRARRPSVIRLLDIPNYLKVRLQVLLRHSPSRRVLGAFLIAVESLHALSGDAIK